MARRDVTPATPATPAAPAIPAIPAAASAPAALRLRPVQADDLPVLQAWLPAGADLALPQQAADGQWWLATEAGGRPLATLRLRPAIGLVLPRPWFHVGCVVHAAPALGLHHRLTRLQLGHDLTGAAELAEIAWDPALDAPAAAQAGPAPACDALQAALAALVAEAQACWRALPLADDALLIAELPGLRDAAGSSPFWAGLGRHFFRGDPQAAAARLGPAWVSHVAALLPRQPVYAAFLPPEAQAAIGVADRAAQPLQAVLQAAGFRRGAHVRVHDGGPVLVCTLG